MPLEPTAAVSISLAENPEPVTFREGVTPVTFRKGVTPWLPFRRPG
jgi:hypothetical protein